MESTEKPMSQSAVIVESIAPAPAPKLTLAEVRAKLDGKTGKRYWKNLDELAATPAFHALMEEEFPKQSMGGVGEWLDSTSRRGFLKVMGASFALAGLAGCTKQPDEPIYPYVKQPEDLILGKPMFFATAHPFPTGAIPVLVKSDAFRPIKIEGNPEHPASKGKSDAITQATLLGLYDPDRSQHVVHRGNTTDFSAFQSAFVSNMAAKKGSGAGVYFLSQTITSPTLAGQWKQVQAAYPQARLVQYDAVNRDAAMTASKAVFGDFVDAQYKLEDADVILSLDADFLSGIAHPGFLTLAAAYAARHRYEEGKTMNRLYVVESMATVTGFKAEHRLGLKPSDLAAFAQALVSGTGVGNPAAQKFAAAVLADLKKNAGRCVVIPGEQAPASVHAAAHLLNAQFGNVGKTVVYTETVNPLPSIQSDDLKALVADMAAGKVEWLVVLGGNPLYDAPADLNFQALYAKVPNTVHLGMYVDETAEASQWHINQAHYLESWSDARTYDGTLTVIQPMIEPLYGGKTSHQLLQILLDAPGLSAMTAVANTAKPYTKDELGWRKALHSGWVDGTAFTPKAVTAKGTALPATSPAGGVEISFRPDTGLYDGRFANIGWLQETPRQVTNLSWDNAALMSLETMAALKLEETDVVELKLNGRTVKAPVLMVPGHPDNSITVHLGSGHRTGGRVSDGVGFNAYLIRTSDAPLSAANVQIKKVDTGYAICVTKVHNIEHRGDFAQHDLEKKESDKEGVYSLAGHEAMERSIIRYATLDEVKKNPNFAHEEGA
ncbi:MAG TPA: TAT-variant-translocated molybdopterin oxidoreductase, partial [Acidobacteriaceae bacterium]